MTYNCYYSSGRQDMKKLMVYLDDDTRRREREWVAIAKENVRR